MVKMDINIALDKVLLPVLNFATLTVLGLAAAWLKRKFQVAGKEHNNLLWDDIDDLVETTVLSLNQTMVDGLKKNGEWSQAKADEIKDTAFNKIVASAEPKLQKLIENNQQYVADLIERKVFENKL